MERHRDRGLPSAARLGGLATGGAQQLAHRIIAPPLGNPAPTLVRVHRALAGVRRRARTQTARALAGVHALASAGTDALRKTDRVASSSVRAALGAITSGSRQVLGLVGQSAPAVVEDVTGLTSSPSPGVKPPLAPFTGLLGVGRPHAVGQSAPAVVSGPRTGWPQLAPVPAGAPAGPGAVGVLAAPPLLSGYGNGLSSAGAFRAVSVARRTVAVPGLAATAAAMSAGPAPGSGSSASSAHGGGAPAGLILLLGVLLVPASWRRLRLLTPPRLPVTLAHPLERPG